VLPNARVLEARIIPERIEHWIEPEQHGSEAAEIVRKVFALLFRRERGDIFCSGRRVACKSAADTAASTSSFWSKRLYDFFEARIAAEGVPERV